MNVQIEMFGMASREDIMSVHEVTKVGYKLPDKEPVIWDFLSEEHLKILTVRAEDIKEIQYSQYYPGDIYVELPIARETHPAMGSFSAQLLLKDGRSAEKSDIWYQDFKSHPPIRTPHWNHQTRFMLSDWSAPKILNIPENHHQLPKSDYIEIIWEDSRERKVNRLSWKKPEEVVKKKDQK